MTALMSNQVAKVTWWLMMTRLIRAAANLQPTATDLTKDDYSFDGWTPQPTKAPAAFLVQERQYTDMSACGIMKGDSQYSDLTYGCQQSEACLSTGNWWGCCFRTPVPGCYEWQCPSVTSCVQYEQLDQCDQDCESDTNVLKCTDTNRPYCATALAVRNVASSTHTGPNPIQLACEPSPYSLKLTVSASYPEPLVCAPPWAENPASLSAWSAANPSFAHSFHDLFAGIVGRGAANSIMWNNRTIPPTITTDTDILSFPTTASTTISTTSSGAAASNQQASNYMPGVLLAGFALAVIM